MPGSTTGWLFVKVKNRGCLDYPGNLTINQLFIFLHCQGYTALKLCQQTKPRYKP